MDVQDGITIISWVKVPESSLDGSSDQQIILNKEFEDRRDGIGYEIAVGDSNKKGYFNFYLPGVAGKFSGYGNAGRGWTVGSNKPIADGQWHMVAVTYNSSTGEIKTYVDGVLQKTYKAPPGTKIGTNNGPIWIGRRGKGPNTASFLKNGSISNVKVFSRALSPDEILLLNQSPNALIGDVLDMPLINDTTDRSGNGYAISTYGNPIFDGLDRGMPIPQQHQQSPVKSPIPLPAIILALITIPIIALRKLAN